MKPQPSTPTAYAHVFVSRDGVPNVNETRLRVSDVAVAHVHYGQSAEQIKEEWYPFLSLGEIYSALAYYFDHKDEIDHAIAENERQADAFFAEYEQTPQGQRTRAKIEALRQRT